MARSPRTPDSERGFSLIEVLIALVILGFVALGIASLFTHAQLTNASGYQYAVIATEARRAIEGIQSLSFDDAALDETSGTPREWTAAAPGYTIIYTVEDFGLVNWTSLADFTATPPTPLAPGAWPDPATTPSGEARLKRITIRVSSDNRFLAGRREFVVTTLKIPDSNV
jgi:prepilin-type N-terminal cleavage/methylation domain-containing protein